MRAIGNVRRRYTPEQWIMLDVKEVTKEIYDEIRRLDLGTVQTGQMNGDRHPAAPKSRTPPKAVDDRSVAVVWAAE
jgi:hypothetical protein